MKRITTSIAILAILFLLLIVTGGVSVPPRRLTAYHLHQFSLIPVCAFLAALPGVPIRWFAYFASLAVAALIAMFSYHINGTSSLLNWDNGLSKAILPILIIVAVVTASTLSAWLRQILHKGFGKLMRNANKSVDSYKSTRADAA